MMNTEYASLILGDRVDRTRRNAFPLVRRAFSLGKKNTIPSLPWWPRRRIGRLAIALPQNFPSTARYLIDRFVPLS